VTEALTAFEDRLIAEQPTLEATAAVLLAAERDALAAELLTRYSNQKAMEGLRIGEALLASLEVRTRLVFGFREPTTAEMSRLDYRMVTCQAPPP